MIKIIENKRIHSVLEDLFLRKSYQEIILYFEEHIDEIDIDPVIGEIVSASYIEIGEYRKALKYIDVCIELVRNGYPDDYAMFLILKMEVCQFKNKPLKEYLLLQKYKNIEGVEKSEEFLSNEILLEDELFRIYNKGFIIMTLISILINIISVITSISIGKSFMSSISIIMAFFVLFNYLFDKYARNLFVKSLRLLSHILVVLR